MLVSCFLSDLMSKYVNEPPPPAGGRSSPPKLQDGGEVEGGEDGGREGGLSPPNYDTSNPVLHVVVVGFHHKKGCQGIWTNIIQASIRGE